MPIRLKPCSRARRASTHALRGVGRGGPEDEVVIFENGDAGGSGCAGDQDSFLGDGDGIGGGNGDAAGEGANDGHHPFNVYQSSGGVYPLYRVDCGVAADNEHRLSVDAAGAVDVLGGQLYGVAQGRAKFRQENR